MTLWKTLILAAVVVALGLYITKVELPKDEEKKRAEILFPDLKDSELKELTLKSAESEVKLVQDLSVASTEKAQNADEVEIVDVDISRWRIDGLPSAGLERGTLNSVISALRDVKREYEIPSEERQGDLAVYGLKDPALTVSFSSGNKNVSLLVGKENEMLKKRYMKLEGNDAVFMGGSAFYLAANKKRDDFRDKTPLDFFDSQVTKFQLKSDKVDSTIEAGSNLSWRIVTPVSYTASNTAVTDLLRNLRNLQVAEFIDTPKALTEYGLDKPMFSVTITFNEAAKREPINVKIGKAQKDNSFYFLIDGNATVYKLGADPTANFSKQLDDLREKQPFKFQFEDVVSAEFTPKEGEKISLTRQGEGWLINGKNADAPFVKEVLDNVAAVSADSFPTDTRDYGFATPTFTWTVMVNDDSGEKKQEKKLVFVAGAETEKGSKKLYAAAGDLTEAIIINEATIKKISPRVETLLKIDPTPTPTVEAKSVAPAP